MKRRTFHILSFAGLIALLPRFAWGQAALRATPQDTEGPYYPERWTGDIDQDLLIAGGAAATQGTPMNLRGTVRDVTGAVLANVQVEIWQTDHTGRYRHSRDDGEAPLARGFQGYGRTRTDAQGQYNFRTLKPVAYGGRPPHVHVRVQAPGTRTLTTQMYFANENTERSGWMGGFSKERDALTVTPQTRTEAGRTVVSVSFDLVLARA